jgi:phage I-like protein
MRIFDYTERAAQATPQAEQPQYATRKEIEEIRAEIAALTKRTMKRAKEEMPDEQPAV